MERAHVSSVGTPVIHDRPRLLFLITEDWYFWSHRLDLARAARDAGFEVTIAARVTEHGDRIRREGFCLLPIRLRRKTHPFADAAAIIELTRIYRRVRPHIVHQVGIKPILYGSLAAWMSGVHSVVNAFAGLGYVFTDAGGRAGFLRPFLMKALQFVIAGTKSTVLFQNAEDRQQLVDSGVVRQNQARIIAGSGVDTEKFVPRDPLAGVPIIMLASRMLWAKGVEEFVRAASLLKARGVIGRFLLVGRSDLDNPGGISRAHLETWVREGSIEWCDHTDDMPTVLGSATIVVLPSFYREGLPKVLLEAAACGKPLIATDVPGCREVVRDKITGLLVPVRDADALARAIGSLLADPEARAAMGRAGREMVIREYSVSRIAEETLALYRDLLNAHSPGAHLQALV